MIELSLCHAGASQPHIIVTVQRVGVKCIDNYNNVLKDLERSFILIFTSHMKLDKVGSFAFKRHDE